MKTLLIFYTILFQHYVLAETISGQVHSVEEGIVKFQNGRVAFIKENPFQLSPGDIIEAKLDETFELKSFKKIDDASESPFNKSMSFHNNPPPFEPTIVPDMKEAIAIFNRSNPNYTRLSECTDRAHIWAHDEFKRTGVKSKKVFVFFTASYINSVRFKWWFHVAPLYLVNLNETIQSLVMDYRYSDRPMSVKEWTDNFVYTKRECKVTTKFSEYDVNPQTENCYLIYESMHYKMPEEIMRQETNGRYKTTTTESELRMAFSLGFFKD